MKPTISNDSCYEMNDSCYKMIAMIVSNNDENISDNDYEMIHLNLALRHWNKICEQKGVHSGWNQTNLPLIQVQLQNGLKFFKFLPW